MADGFLKLEYNDRLFKVLDITNLCVFRFIESWCSSHEYCDLSVNCIKEFIPGNASRITIVRSLDWLVKNKLVQKLKMYNKVVYIINKNARDEYLKNQGLETENEPKNESSELYQNDTDLYQNDTTGYIKMIHPSIKMIQNLYQNDTPINKNIRINKNINKNVVGISQNSTTHTQQKTSSKKQQKFIKPTEQEVFDEMYQKLGDFNQAELLSQKFIAHYESVGWKVGKNPMKNWKACVRTWLLSEKQKQPSKQWKPNKEKTTDELVSEGLKDFKKHFGFDLENNNSVIDITNQQIGQIGVNNDSN